MGIFLGLLLTVSSLSLLIKSFTIDEWKLPLLRLTCELKNCKPLFKRYRNRAFFLFERNSLCRWGFLYS